MYLYDMNNCRQLFLSRLLYKKNFIPFFGAFFGVELMNMG